MGFGLWAVGFRAAKSQRPKAESPKLLVLLCLCVLNFAACGRKGPPLAPIVLLPAPVGEFAAKRAGEDVVLHLKVPAANTDSSTPPDLDRVEVYAHTGPLPAPTDFVKYGTLIATIVNERTENIGARRLHTVMERLLDEISFEGPDLRDKMVTIDAAYVDRMLASIVKNEDLSRYIL